jgi:hypothetical protein
MASCQLKVIHEQKQPHAPEHEAERPTAEDHQVANRARGCSRSLDVPYRRLYLDQCCFHYAKTCLEKSSDRVVLFSPIFPLMPKATLQTASMAGGVDLVA